MNHDIQSAWASSELATEIKTNPALFFSSPPSPASISVFAGREKRERWPLVDGVVTIEYGSSSKYSLAVEFKQTSEGVHGILTALGQANAYIHKGFSGSVIILPKAYDSHPTPAQHLRDIINRTEEVQPIGVFSYDDPNPTATSPFKGKLKCERKIDLNSITHVSIPTGMATHSETQWAHLREGSSDPSAFYLYLKTAKRISAGNLVEPSVSIPDPLKSAVLAMGISNPLKYLSNTVSDDLHNVIWRNFWFDYILTSTVMALWKKRAGNYLVNHVPTKIQLFDGSYKYFFSGRSDSIKNRLVDDLNSRRKSEVDAWKEFAENIHNRAHSYREDIDSGLENIEFLGQDGRPTEIGYKFVDACERINDANTGTPKLILGSAILGNGQLGAFLHYVYRISEEKFKRDPMAFSTRTHNSISFMKNEYLKWLETEMANNLNVIHKVSLRGGVRRLPFQAELAILRYFDFVSGFRVGVGMEINWPKVQEAFEFSS